MTNVQDQNMYNKDGEADGQQANTLEARTDGKPKSSLLCGEWYEPKSDNPCYTKSANSPSQTNYSDPDSTPHEFSTLSSDSSQETNNNINTVHRTKGMYAGLDNYASIGMMTTPSISISGLDSIYNPLASDLIDLSTIMCDTLNDESLATARDMFYIEHEELFYERAELIRQNKNKIANFFNSLTCTKLVNEAEDWGIDRSIYTVYSRSGFFADCHRADQLFHGEYLNHWGMEYFAECRMPLVFCIILADCEVRKNEVQSSIVPLAISLLDRYMAKNKSCPSKLTKFVYSKVKTIVEDGDDIGEDMMVSDGGLNERPFEIDPRYLDESDFDFKNEDSPSDKEKMVINVEIVYNLVAASCYFIADRYNGLANVSVRALLLQWAATCRLFTKTRYCAYYIFRNRAAALSIVMSLMFDIYSTLDYVITTPFVSFMVQNLIITSGDIPYPQNPSYQNLFLSTGSILSRIALIDDTFHRFPASIVTLAIYSLIRKLAYHEKVITTDANTWLRVDETNIDIKECMNLLVKTLSQFVNTEILDALTQPIDVKNANEEIFALIIQGETNNLDLDGIRRISRILSS